MEPSCLRGGAGVEGRGRHVGRRRWDLRTATTTSNGRRLWWWWWEGDGGEADGTNTNTTWEAGGVGGDT